MAGEKAAGWALVELQLGGKTWVGRVHTCPPHSQTSERACGGHCGACLRNGCDGDGGESRLCHFSLP